MAEDCIFCRIINGEIPSDKVYEDDDVFAFLDIAPVRKGHTLVIPKKHFKCMEDVDEDTFLKLMAVVKKIAPSVKNAVGAKGFNMFNNNHESADQLVPHIHIHIIPRFEKAELPMWPQGEYEGDEAKKIAEKITSYLD